MGSVHAAHLFQVFMQAVESISSSFQEARTSLHAQAGPVTDAIVDVLMDRCLAVLRQLRGITATYRMTAR